MQTLIVIPTYEEADNINLLLGKIFDATKEIHILFVDDHSPDGTQEIIRWWQSKYPEQIYLMARPAKLGLGTAYVAGFRWGLENGYDTLIEMDADLSHDPKMLPEILSRLRSYDVVIGSRYVNGAAIVNWGFWRRMISRAGSLYARVVLGVKIHDMTGGFNGWRHHVIKDIGLDQIESEGYAFQIELKYRALRMGFTCVEVPIIFTDRRVGRSKMSWHTVVEAIVRVWLLAARTRFRS